MGWMVRRCAKGTKFDQALCRCKPINDVVNEGTINYLFLNTVYNNSLPFSFALETTLLSV